ncbi:MAG: YbaN family protein [Proteobacteria bacterium]|nr:YbaN family protein [Pseudomonadota bacterium]
MQQGIKQKLLIALGWVFVVLGAIGAVLPIMPTTVFLIIALWVFSKSSPRFHKMLLDNKYFGAGLRQWEESKTISKESKRKATTIILITFGVSIAILHSRIGLQIMLVAIAMVLLSIIWMIKESR